MKICQWFSSGFLVELGKLIFQDNAVVLSEGTVIKANKKDLPIRNSRNVFLAGGAPCYTISAPTTVGVIVMPMLLVLLRSWLVNLRGAPCSLSITGDVG